MSNIYEPHRINRRYDRGKFQTRVFAEYPTKRCRKSKDIDNVEVNILAVTTCDKKIANPFSDDPGRGTHSYFIIPAGSKLKLVKYFTDSRIFSFHVSLDTYIRGYAKFIYEYSPDTINLRENEFEWIDPAHSPVVYFEQQA